MKKILLLIVSILIILEVCGVVFATIDYSCTVDSDCEIKNVGNLCGYYPLCVNNNFAPKLPELNSSICGYPAISYCKCGDNKCVGFDKTLLITSKCSDSDGGKNYYIQGKINADVGNPYNFSVSDECTGNFLIEYYCNGLNVTDEAFNCPDGCRDGACIKNELPVQEQCEPIGLRKSGDYCSSDKNWIKQKISNEVCENNFECTSNVCVSGKCVNENLLQKILNWFAKLFGGK